MADDPNAPPQINGPPPNLQSLPNLGPTPQQQISGMPQMAPVDSATQSLDLSDQFYQQQLKANTPQPSTGGPVRHFLQNFFSGMGNSMMHNAGLPTQTDLQQRALTGLQNNAVARGNLALHQMMMQQYGTTPVQTPQGIINVMNRDMGRVYAAQTGEQGRLGASETAHPTTTITQDLATRFPQLQNFVGQDMLQANVLSLISQQGKNETQQAIASQAQGNKLDIFRQSQQYLQWKAILDNQTKLQIAQISAGKAPAAMMQAASFAQSGLNRLDDAQAAMARLEARGVLGNVASNKIEDWIFGKGLVDPTLPAQDKVDIGKLRAAASYTSSAAMRAHTGRTSREIYDDFKNTIGINQGPDAWKGAMQETRSMLNDYAQGATNAAIMKLRGGTSPATTGGVNPGTGGDPFVQFGGRKR